MYPIISRYIRYKLGLQLSTCSGKVGWAKGKSANLRSPDSYHLARYWGDRNSYGLLLSFFFFLKMKISGMIAIITGAHPDEWLCPRNWL